MAYAEHTFLISRNIQSISDSNRLNTVRHKDSENSEKCHKCTSLDESNVDKSLDAIHCTALSLLVPMERKPQDWFDNCGVIKEPQDPFTNTRAYSEATMMRLVGSVITSATLVHCLWGPQQPPMSDPMGSAPPCCHYRLRTDTIGECVPWKCSYSQQQPNMIPRSNLTDCNCIVETGTKEPSPDVMKDSPGFEPSPCRAELPVQPCDCPPGAHLIPPLQKSDMEPKPPDWSTETSPAQSTVTSQRTAPTDDSSIKTNASSIATRSQAVEPVTEPITNTAKPSNKILPEFLVNPENKPPFDANQTLEALKTRDDNFKKTSSDSGAMTIGVLVAVIGAIVGLVIVIIIRQRKVNNN
uniref:Uncharacterized protein n=1 Tax=Biomphalaria glabrata TaxID=6526 RepID=A0A2C9LSD9_BIOGL